MTSQSSLVSGNKGSCQAALIVLLDLSGTPEVPVLDGLLRMIKASRISGRSRLKHGSELLELAERDLAFVFDLYHWE